MSEFEERDEVREDPPGEAVQDIRPLNMHPDAAMPVQATERRYLLQHETAPLMREVNETEYREAVAGDGGKFWRIVKYWNV